MKQLFLLLALLLFAFISNAQIVQSTCVAHDSIKDRYMNDAQRLALRKIFRQNLSYVDSIQIPQSHTDTVLNALLAVYNATTLPARDTIIGTGSSGIHTNPVTPLMQNLLLEADPSAPWVPQLLAGNSTSDSTLNHIINSNQLYVIRQPSYWFGLIYIELKTNTNKNLHPLLVQLKTVPGIIEVYKNHHWYDGPDIYDSIYSDHVELIYDYSWGDCLSGCAYHRYWKFKVYFDCRVEYVGSYGNSLPVTGNKEKIEKTLTVYPNPFKEAIMVEGVTGPFQYTVTNLLGQQVLQGESESVSMNNLKELLPGLYLLTIQENDRMQTFRIIKE